VPLVSEVVKCPICGKVLKSKRGLGPHMKVHKKEQQKK